MYTNPCGNAGLPLSAVSGRSCLDPTNIDKLIVNMKVEYKGINLDVIAIFDTSAESC